MVTDKKVSDKEVVIFISSEKPRCRKCGEELFGGEIDFGVCDCCNED